MLVAERDFDEREDGYESGKDAAPVRGSGGTVLAGCKAKWNDEDAAWRRAEFFKSLPSEAMRDLAERTLVMRCRKGAILQCEDVAPAGVLLVLQGTVKRSMNSTGGRRLMMGLAGPGEMLGLAAVLANGVAQIESEAQSVCVLGWLPRPTFLDFLLHHSAAGKGIGELLSLENQKACEQLRMLSLMPTAPQKLARLLLMWCGGEANGNSEAQVRCAMTHQELGEYIGATRETVTRTLMGLRRQEIVTQRGSVLMITDVKALALLAELN